MVKLKIVSKIKEIKRRIDELEKGWKGTIIAFAFAFLLAYSFHKTLAFALSTPQAAVIVYTKSMQHDDPEIKHYAWLEKNLNYSREFINSWPFSNGLYVGDIVILQGREEYEVGDIIVYSVEGYSLPLIHRIIKINEDGTYQTKGDNNYGQLNFEKRIEKEKIYGKVIFAIPRIGYVKVFIARVWEGMKSAVL